MRDIVVIAHNLRSSHNVGSLLRTADGLGVDKVYLTGYTPYPIGPGDVRMPHLAAKISKDIAKTALGAEASLKWQHIEDVGLLISKLRKHGYLIAGLEQSEKALKIPDYHATNKIALLLGRETEGLEPEVIKLCDLLLEIPMFGKKESFNVVQAAAMALYHLRFD